MCGTKKKTNGSNGKMTMGNVLMISPPQEKGERHVGEIEQVIDVLERAERIGAKEDKPEGTRYIMLSETLTQLLISKLKTAQRKGEA